MGRYCLSKEGRHARSSAKENKNDIEFSNILGAGVGEGRESFMERGAPIPSRRARKGDRAKRVTSSGKRRGGEEGMKWGSGLCEKTQSVLGGGGGGLGEKCRDAQGPGAEEGHSEGGFGT